MADFWVTLFLFIIILIHIYNQIYLNFVRNLKKFVAVSELSIIIIIIVRIINFKRFYKGVREFGKFVSWS